MVYYIPIDDVEIDIFFEEDAENVKKLINDIDKYSLDSMNRFEDFVSAHYPEVTDMILYDYRGYVEAFIESQFDMD